MTKYVKARTENQRDYIVKAIGNDLTLCTGPAGTGKSYIAIGIALELMERKDSQYTKLYLTRPMESCGNMDFPSVPGDVFEKYAPYMRPLLCILEGFLGPKDLRIMIEKKIIELIPLELMRGMTFDNSIVILDEFQNATPNQAAMSITRMGKDYCKMIYTGDIRQKDIGDFNYGGLEILVDSLHDKEDVCAYAKLAAEDNQRNPKIIQILKYMDMGL